MVAFSCCPWRGGSAAELAGRDLGVLGLQRRDHIVGGQVVVVQLGRVQPDPHGVLGAEELHFADPFQPADDVLDVGDHVVGQGVAVHGAVFRDQADDHQEVPGGFDHLRSPAAARPGAGAAWPAAACSAPAPGRCSGRCRP